MRKSKLRVPRHPKKKRVLPACLSCDHRSNTIASMRDRTVMFEVDDNAAAQQNSGRSRGEVISLLQQNGLASAPSFDNKHAT
jgi:hypothetical protein